VRNGRRDQKQGLDEQTRREGGREGGKEGNVPRHASKPTNGKLIKQFLAQLHVPNEEQLGVVLQEGEGVVDCPHEDVFFEDGVHASVGREGGKEGGRGEGVSGCRKGRRRSTLVSCCRREKVSSTAPTKM